MLKKVKRRQVVPLGPVRRVKEARDINPDFVLVLRT
jgi:hypothetical protein